MNGKGDREPLRLGVLGSTRGTDLQALIEAQAAGKLHASVVQVISSRKDAFILERARSCGIQAAWLPRKAGGPVSGREEYDRRLDVLLKKSGAELILLIGWMRILSPWFCAAWENRVINVHPSLLPEFAGGMDTDVHAAVIKAGRKESGCTVHIAAPEVDSGPIILQKRCPVLEDDTPQTLKSRVQKLEGEALIEAVNHYAAFGSFDRLVIKKS